MPRDPFVLKIQRELCHPKCARKVSGPCTQAPLFRADSPPFCLAGTKTSPKEVGITFVDNNNNDNKSELYLHDYNNTALQKRRKHDNYSNLIIRVQFQLGYIFYNIYPIFQEGS